MTKNNKQTKYLLTADEQKDVADLQTLNKTDIKRAKVIEKDSVKADENLKKLREGLNTNKKKPDTKLLEIIKAKEIAKKSNE